MSIRGQGRLWRGGAAPGGGVVLGRLLVVRRIRAPVKHCDLGLFQVSIWVYLLVVGWVVDEQASGIGGANGGCAEIDPGCLMVVGWVYIEGMAGRTSPNGMSSSTGRASCCWAILLCSRADV